MAQTPVSIADLYDMEAPYVTEYRRLLHRIMNQDREEPVKSVLVTSAMVGEGKSTACCLLALTAVMKKKLKTLIVDADLRKPSVHKLFGLPAGPGLSEVLAEGHDPTDALHKTAVENLHVLTCGRLRENPTEVFDPEAIGRLIDEMKFYYDLIVVDCAPLLPVSDPMLLAPKVDGVLLVVKAGSTQKEVAQRAVQIVDPETSNVLGVVLNNMNHSLPYYYDYEYYHYDYSPKRLLNQRATGKKKPAKEERGAAKKEDSPQDNVARS
ncbi:MAG: CpsD/CapB family tyrosine-protein kinase [Candidatus Zixiibacteriota bacterium]|nr:MAG: CpsD/CapB family tyrosine-protein kinase [candidate division Zixibacteria bacterium]